MNDYISKSSVCEILANIYPTDGEKVVSVKEIDKAYEEILQLSSVQRDTISRQAAIHAFDGAKPPEEYCPEYQIGYNDGIDCAISIVSVLPPASIID